MPDQNSQNCIIVTSVDASRGQLRWDDQTFECALGKGGISDEKIEGDGVTPVGRFPLRHILYRPDRIEKPICNMPVYATEQDNGWCDAPDHPDYNRFVHLPHPARCESLWREDRVYDLIVVIGYNDDPIQSGKGSAIFMHVARPDFEPTEGCIALKLDDLKFVVRNLNKESFIEIQPD